MKHLAENVLELDIKKHIEGVRTGRIVDVDDKGQVRVDFPGNTLGPVPAKFTHAIQTKLNDPSIEDVPILLVFENNDPGYPVIIDLVYTTVDQAEEYENTLEFETPEDVEVDGERIYFNAEKEIVLNCGKSSITLTQAGKIIIRGAYVLNRSSGANLIKGASVRIN